MRLFLLPTPSGRLLTHPWHSVKLPSNCSTFVISLPHAGCFPPVPLEMPVDLFHLAVMAVASFFPPFVSPESNSLEKVLPRTAGPEPVLTGNIDLRFPHLPNCHPSLALLEVRPFTGFRVA